MKPAIARKYAVAYAFDPIRQLRRPATTGLRSWSRINNLTRRETTRGGIRNQNMKRKEQTMTIMCPERLHEAVMKAIEVDDLVESLLLNCDDVKRHAELVQLRGKACRSLLQCLAARAYGDGQENKHPFFRDDSDICYPSGRRITMSAMRSRGLPLRETVLFDDIAPHSFFFREVYRDPDTREVIEVYDRCWYVFPQGVSQEKADAVEQFNLESLLSIEGYRRTFDREEAEASRKDGRAVRETTVRRTGMCGGIIFHRNYRDGEPDGTGSWSTHT